ncbi:MAG TPA: FliA/WhiG family RNA polymerase sigma factor [Bryobacteraceae bacterium]|nr:FliA/WhiG family RNA polymerase sigma factor [Bryobacteraceae bacterium]
MVFEKKSTSTSDMADRDQRVLKHLALAKVVALRVYQTLPVHVDLEDLVQAGVLGLLDAAKRYDAKRQVDFAAYAKHRIRGAILDSLRQLDMASRDLRRQAKIIESTRHKLRGILERDPTESEIAEHLPMGIARLRKITLEIHSIGEISSGIPSPNHEGPEEHEFESKTESHPDTMYSRIEMREALAGAMSFLRPRQRTVVRLYYVEHKTMKQIGLSLGVNESRISQLHKSALKRMRIELEARGVHSQQAL